ncbi:hypothetical protein D1007_40690 [Hordeum vulgare]|nr:hypothetical protein D1007_40690 [Hordeum vulgare]
MTRQQVEEAEAEAARAPPAPQLRSREEKMLFLVSTIQGMEKNIFEILLNQKSLERIMDTKFHDLDVKVTELATTVDHLKHEVDAVHAPRSSSDDDDSPLLTTTLFRTQSSFELGWGIWSIPSSLCSFCLSSCS